MKHLSDTTAQLLIDLATRVHRLNPHAGEIGAGMLADLHARAGTCLDAVEHDTVRVRASSAPRLSLVENMGERPRDVFARFKYKLARINEQNEIEYRVFTGSYAEIPNGWVYVERSPA